ncbi:MAG: hypothetical protein H7323_04045 [Frankiales bacterium]|nr:hypothetical protein [Frankiales bacterium]
MRLFATKPPHLPLEPPTSAGAGWPEQGRPSFDSSTFHELAVRHAYDPEAHAVADRLVADLLPRLNIVVGEQDAPYLTKVLTTAARVGAGVAIVERTVPTAPAGAVDRRIAGALWEARSKLPAMQPDWGRTAGFLLLAGFHLARTGPVGADDLLAGLG